MNSLSFIDDPPRDGALNMALDHFLSLQIRQSGMAGVLRLYRWERPTLSCGFHQRAERRIDFAGCQRFSVDVVRRPTGGRELLHDGDLSFSLVISRGLGYENTDGQGTFGAQQVISTNADGASCVYVGDFNGDNKVDIVSSSYYDNKVAWYENTMVLGINENSLISFKLFPNPVKNFLEITTSNDVSKIEIFNSLGQKILIKLNSQIIDVSNIYEGIYFIKITTLNGNILTRKFIKE